LQNRLCDILFKEVYSKFKNFFNKTTTAFRREVSKKLEFRRYEFFKPEYENFDNDKISMPMNLCNFIIKKGEKPKAIYFILKGEVKVGNSTGEYEYFKLGPGNFFGDTSLMLGTKTTYSYTYDIGKSVSLLKLSSVHF